ncbi:MAG: DUF1566 domain-containing protein [Treponema sp.]|jgi:hypothetical protein|nr:DUF1566 domain-containing protein [Treponema sp.]
MKKRFSLIAILACCFYCAIIVLMFGACTKKSETAAAVSAESYAKILNGDFSDFAGTWVNGKGTRVELKPDGIFGNYAEYPDVIIGNVRIAADGVYLWGIGTEWFDSPITLYPVGIDVMGGDGILQTDTTKVRITAVDIPYRSEEVFYREGEAPHAAAALGSYKIGDTGPAGGIIFYDKGNDSNGWRYMEAAVNFDITSSHAWGYFSNNIGTRTTIGTGKENTGLMLAAGAAPAAQACVDFRGGGKNDWFLPSKDELNELYKQRSHFENTRLSFWSSSQGNEYNAWNQNFDNGKQEYNDNTNDFAYSVRAIRSFSADTVSQGTTQTTTHYAKILSGDFSAFAGTWVTGEGRTNPLNASGVFGSGNAYNFKEIDSGYFEWIVNWGGEAGEVPIRLYPAGVEIFNTWTGSRVQTDTAKDRITVMDVVRNDEVYYQPDYHVQFKGETIYMIFTLLPQMSGNTKIGDILTYLNFAYEDKQQQIDLEYLGPISYTGQGSISISAGDYNADGHMDLTLNGVIVLYNPQAKSYPTPNDPYAGFSPQGSQ